MNEADFIEALRAHWMAVAPTLTTGGQEPLPALLMWEDDEGVPDPPAPYHRTTLRGTGAQAVTVGRTREESRGLVTVQVFAPAAAGPGPAERLAAAVAAAWRTFRHSRVRLSPPDVIGLPRQGGFNRQLVRVVWRGDLRPALQ